MDVIGRSGQEFRWHFTDDGIGEQWTEWHIVADRCPACCCGAGPIDGEHRAGAAFYDEDGILDWNCHSRYDPITPDFPMVVEWRQSDRVTRLGPEQ